MNGHVVAWGPCWSCGDPFHFDAELVPSIPIDPVTNRPPDLGGNAERAVKQPICPRCCRRANVRRRATGIPLINESDTSGLT